MKFSDTFQEKILPKVATMANNKFLKGVGDGFMAIMPAIIVGSIFSLLNSLSIKPYQEFITSTGLKQILAIPNAVTNDLLAIFAVFFIAYNLAKSYNKDSATAGMIALFTFLAITHLGNTSNIIGGFIKNNGIALPEGVAVPSSNVLLFEYLGAKGLFVAIIVAIFSTMIYAFCIDRGFSVKMPDSVPPTVTKSFAGLVPGFVVITVFMVLDKLISLIPMNGVNGIHTFIYSLVQAPIEMFLGNNIFSFLFAILIAQILWFFGVHGVNAIIIPLFLPLWTSLTTANIEAMNAGTSLFELPNIINRAFFSVYAVAGGSGVTLGLCIYMMIKSRSKQYRTLGKLAFASNICAINEPLVFGIPMVLNPYMAIPWIITPLVISSLAYFLTLIKVLPRLTTLVPLGTPVIMSGILAGGSEGWRVALFQVVAVVISGLIYLPFFNVIDKQSYELEVESGEVNM